MFCLACSLLNAIYPKLYVGFDTLCDEKHVTCNKK